MDADFTSRQVARICEAARPLRVVLFGSAARGDDRPADVVVVIDDGVRRCGESPGSVLCAALREGKVLHTA